MTTNTPEEKTYSINLPLDQALEVSSQLQELVWEVADEKEVREILEKSQFRVVVAQPALVEGAVITVVVTYLGGKIVDKITGRVLDKLLDASIEKVEEIWSKLILPELRKRLGNKALVEKED